MTTQFTIFPIGKEHPIVVFGDERAYKRDLRKGIYKIHTFVVVGISLETAKELCRRADDRGTSKLGWYAHNRKLDYIYRIQLKNPSHPNHVRVKYIDVNTYYQFRQNNLR